MAWEIPDWLNKTAWSEFEQHRKSDAKLRKGWSDLARAKCANRLKGLTHEQQQECIDQSIMNGWSGLFPPKPQDRNFQVGTLPRSDSLLPQFAQANGLSQPRVGEGYEQYRQRLTEEMRRH